MKTLIAAVTLLLALVSLGYAVEIPKDWQNNYDLCMSDDESPAHARACVASRKVEKQLYQEGVRDYRAGQCYRARPYTRSDGSNSSATWIWERGYDAQRKQHRRDMSHCFR